MIKNLFGKQLLFFDGAMATQLQKAGLKTGEIPDIWNITHSDIVQNIHAQYLAAGCDIIKTNTFGSNTHNLKSALADSGTGFSVEQIVTSAVENAKTAIRAYENSKSRFIALDIGPSGKLLKPLGDLYFEDAVELFKKTVVVGANAGANLVLIETMSDVYELKAAVIAAKENCALPVIASVTLDEKGNLLTGGSLDVVVALLEGLRVDVIGLNCGYGMEQLSPHITQMLELSGTPVLFMPNAGLPEYVDDEILYDVSPNEFAQIMRQKAQEGVWLLGGCCGTTPAHIEALVKTCAVFFPPAVARKNKTIASSYSKTTVFGEDIIVIGERINPTGKPKLKQALKDGDYDYVLREGILQSEQNAAVLDVNAGVPGIDETAVLASLVEQLQSVTDTPLQIDTANTNAMEGAMRIYNGKPVINSVNGKESVMNAVFPLVQKYGGVVVALTLDENGIPQTAQGRVDIAKKIINYAQKYGLSKEDFLFDPLTMAVSAGQDNALVTLECVRKLKKELGVKTVLGISNVSFGLPAREILNSAFLSLALEAGLNAAILNPNVQIMHKAIDDFTNGKPVSHDTAVDALLGKDENFERYIAVNGGEYSGSSSAVSATVSTSFADSDKISLFDAVLKGLKQQAANSAKKSIELRQKKPLEVIEQELTPALNMAGERFEQGHLYLPQLLMCAEAAKSAFTVIRAAMDGEKDEKIGTIILATVEGDIHDIGKNIVRAILENYRFHVIDLGKDVPVGGVLEAVKKHNAKLIGLSALMTTTVVNMEKTIQALRKADVDCKIMCGGAVLTKEYAASIGADYYAKDAMTGVRYAQKIFIKKEVIL